MPATIAVPLALAGLKALYSWQMGKKARQGLDELEKQKYPEYLSGQNIYQQADAMATGFSPQEKSYLQDRQNRLSTQRFRMASDRNPTLAGSIQAGLNYSGVQAELGMAAQDAQLRRQNLSMLASLIGGQANRQTGSQINRRESQEQAYGQAAAQQDQNLFGALGDASNVLFSYGLNKDYLSALGGRQMTTPIPGMVTSPINSSNPYALPDQLGYYGENPDEYNYPYNRKRGFAPFVNYPR